MKRIISIIAVIAVVILYIGINKYMKKTEAVGVGSLRVEDIYNADLSFSVLGDVHTKEDHLKEAILGLYGINPKMDALVLNGDTVDEGTIKDYDVIKNYLNKNKKNLPKIIIKNIGNHEFFDYKKEINSPEDVSVFIKRYLEFSGENKVYHDRWIKDYHFISLGSEDGNSKTANSVKAYISKEQLQWLKEKLSEKYIKGKPIFVFLHQNLNKTTRGWVGTDDGEELKKILSQYPEVIIFNSHTHQSLKDNNIKLNEPYTVVHTGAVKYTILFNEGKMERVPYNQGLYVEVKGNNVTIKGVDFKEKNWIFTQEVVGK